MKQILVAAALAAASASVLAQGSDAAKASDAPSVQVSPHKCEPRPKLPSKTMMQNLSVRRQFERDYANYRKCINDYVDERNEALRAHQDARNAAIDEFNQTIKELEAAQKAQE